MDGIIFDVDGTLWDSVEVVAESWNLAIKENSDLELTIAGTADYISMVEAGAHEISEEDMLKAMAFGQEAIAAFCEKQSEFLAKVNPQLKNGLSMFLIHPLLSALILTLTK